MSVITKNKTILYISISVFFAFFVFVGEASAVQCKCTATAKIGNDCNATATDTLTLTAADAATAMTDALKVALNGTDGCGLYSAALSLFRGDIINYISGHAITAPDDCTSYNAVSAGPMTIPVVGTTIQNYSVQCVSLDSSLILLDPNAPPAGSTASEPIMTKDAEEIAKSIAGLKVSVGELNMLGSGTTVPELVGRVIRTALGVTGTVALVMLVAGGLMWMTARGNSERIGTALRTITWAAMGIIVILSSYIIVQFIFGAF